jgi:hypothetical protein
VSANNREGIGMANSDDASGNDLEFDQFAEDYKKHRDALFELIAGYMDEQDLEEGYTAQLLLDLTIGMRLTAYGMGVESPSAGGLKLDLDRWRRDVDEFVREAKKGAEDYIRTVKDARVAAETDDDPK